jgi:hypothetical protein
MTRDDLLDSAKRLAPPTEGVVDEFSRKREEMTAQVNTAMAARPDLEQLVGLGGQHMSEDNNRHFSLFMASIMSHYEPEVLLETVLWVFRTYRSHGFHTDYWPANLDTWIDTLQHVLSREAFQEVSPFYAWIRTNIPVFAGLTDHVDGHPRETEQEESN